MSTKTCIASCALIAILTATPASAGDTRDWNGLRDFSTEIHAVREIGKGRQTFRYATFGDEEFWGDTLGLHLAIAGAANGGVG
ncbi:MAG TPA: hypothetical protein VIT67_20280, partial [Povalibacter sp.]